MNHIPSPDTSDAGIERLIQTKGLTAPRVTPADMEANIKDMEIVKHVSVGGQVLRWVIITTANGFAVTGRPSVSVSPENDDPEIGVAVAIANAKNELWPLMGYELRSKLAETKTVTKRYDWRAVQRFDVQEDMLTARLSYRVVMVDGAQFTGTVDLGTEAEIRERILEQCNTPKE